MKITAALTLCAVLFAVPAHALNNYNAWALSCARVQAIIKQEGAAILHYKSKRNPSLPLYDTYAQNSGYCQYDQYAKPYFVPTQDNPKCRAKICRERSFSR